MGQINLFATQIDMFRPVQPTLNLMYVHKEATAVPEPEQSAGFQSQYATIKQRYGSSLLCVRHDVFYLFFDEDATTVAVCTNLQTIPACKPFTTKVVIEAANLNKYLKILAKANHRIAVADKLESNG